MTREDAKKLIMVIDAAYPNFHPDNLSYTVNVWATLLADKDYATIANALKAYIISDRSGFAPTVGQLIGIVNDYADDSLPEATAWSMVCKALRNSAYGAAEEYERLPKTVKKAVGSPDQLRQWGMDCDLNMSVTQSHFLRAYRTAVEREKTDSAIGCDLVMVLTGSSAKALNARDPVNEIGEVNEA